MRLEATETAAGAMHGLTDPEPVRVACQPDCIAARPRAEGGLGLRFRLLGDGSVQAEFGCEPAFQGYADRLHGGVVATLLDAAMSNCLFARRVRGMTARLNIRFRDQIEIGKPAEVQAWVTRVEPPLFELRAEVRQDGEVRALADAKFHGEGVEP